MHYDDDAAAERYDAYRRGGGPFLSFLQELARESSAERVLELGSGTGNNSQAFLEAYPCVLVGLEPSRGMLARAKKKVPEVKWVRGSATHIPFADHVYDFLFAVLVLHHIRDIALVMRECRRVLRRGYAAFVTSPHDYIERHPMNRYFPSFAKVDTKRFHATESIRRQLLDAGFRRVGEERIVGAPQPIDIAYVQKVEGRFLSTFDLIPEEEFLAGVGQLRAEVEKYGVLPMETSWECVVVWGKC